MPIDPFSNLMKNKYFLNLIKELGDVGYDKPDVTKVVLGAGINRMIDDNFKAYRDKKIPGKVLMGLNKEKINMGRKLSEIFGKHTKLKLPFFWEHKR